MINGGWALLGWVICFLLGVLIGATQTARTWKREAVYHKCGEWVVSDTAYGETKFKWRSK